MSVHLAATLKQSGGISADCPNPSIVPPTITIANTIDTPPLMVNNPETIVPNSETPANIPAANNPATTNPAATNPASNNQAANNPATRLTDIFDTPEITAEEIERLTAEVSTISVSGMAKQHEAGVRQFPASPSTHSAGIYNSSPPYAYSNYFTSARRLIPSPPIRFIEDPSDDDLENPFDHTAGDFEPATTKNKIDEIHTEIMEMTGRLSNLISRITMNYTSLLTKNKNLDEKIRLVLDNQEVIMHRLDHIEKCLSSE